MKPQAEVLIVTLSAVAPDAQALLEAHQLALASFLGGMPDAVVELTSNGVVTAVEPQPDYPAAAGYRSARTYTITVGTQDEEG